MRRFALASLVVLIIISPAAARKPARPVWQVMRTSDPITGKSSCVVAIIDRAAGLSFTTTGTIYPFVENNSEMGLLVGVSSGGKVRLPTGDIVWRVDDHPHRELKVADNPAAASTSDDPATRAMSQTLALARSFSATSTVASGDKAREMLDEMIAGSSLQFRSASVTASYGLPDDRARMTGLMTKDGLRPYPLDASFRDALSQCGIGATPRPPAAR
jgi:hypothetical protein